MLAATSMLPDPFAFSTHTVSSSTPQQVRTDTFSAWPFCEQLRLDPMLFAECQDADAPTLFAKRSAPDASNATSRTNPTLAMNTLRPSRFRAETFRRAWTRRKAGTDVALCRVEMFLNELTIIYLATAAPFCVARFVEEREHDARIALSLLKSAAASLAWPVTAFAFLRRGAVSKEVEAVVADECRAPDEKNVERARRAAINALRAVDDLIASISGGNCERERHVLFIARESVERYAGLALACASAREDSQPTRRELELYLTAGRTGDDLIVAGRCLHRRNVARLFAHRERARSELVHALVAAREAAQNVYTSQTQFRSTEHADENAKQISDALLQAFSRIVELLSLFDEREAVNAVASLLDAESTRLLRRINSRHADAAGDNAGEKSCMTQAVHKAFAMPHLPTQRSTGD